MKNKTNKEYLKRINKVLDYIDTNLASDLPLELLSKIALYSPFHFHRVFSTLIGESLNQFLTRKRVERIASILISTPNKTIKELAYTYGFKSESSFSRTFKKYYGVSPTEFKKEGKHILSKNGIALFFREDYIYSIDEINKWNKMNSKIIITQLSEIKLAGISGIGEFATINQRFQKLMRWAYDQEIINSFNFKVIIIYHDNPNVTHISKVRHSACITIDRDIEEYEDIRPTKIRKGIYVVGRFEIKGEEISKAWKYLNIWVMENNHQFRDGDFFEIYHNDHEKHPENKHLLDICIPIEKTSLLTFNKDTDLIFSNSFQQGNQQKNDYHLCIKFIKELKAYLNKEFELSYTIGRLNQSSKDYSYFSFTPEGLKKIKLKIVIIFDHIKNRFTICLSGQNKSIRKKYWNIIKGSDWHQYQLVENIDNSLMIVEHTLIKNPDFNQEKKLIELIEKEALIFINEMRNLFE